jgi:hypothetical protein
MTDTQPYEPLVRSRAVESLADICFIAGHAQYYGGDSRADMDTFIAWANEFESLMQVVDGEELYNGKEYLLAIDEFTYAKIEASGNGRAKSASRVLNSLISDIEAMQMPLREEEGDPAFHDAQRDDYFGPFLRHYDDMDGRLVATDAGLRVCWPNLRILLDEAKAAR